MLRLFGDPELGGQGVSGGWMRLLAGMSQLSLMIIFGRSLQGGVRCSADAELDIVSVVVEVETLMVDDVFM